MKVFLNFVDTSIMIDISSPPRVGDRVNVPTLKKEWFFDKREEQKFLKSSYMFKDWVVKSVCWNIAGEDTWVNIVLEEFKETRNDEPVGTPMTIAAVEGSVKVEGNTYTSMPRSEPAQTDYYSWGHIMTHFNDRPYSETPTTSGTSR